MSKLGTFTEFTLAGEGKLTSKTNAVINSHPNLKKNKWPDGVKRKNVAEKGELTGNYLRASRTESLQFASEEREGMAKSSREENYGIGGRETESPSAT